MAGVNRIEVGGGVGPTGALAGLAGQAMANRQGGGGGAVSVGGGSPPGLQGPMPGMQPVKGSGQKWMQQQKEYAVVENNLVRAHENIQREQNELQMQLTRSMRDGLSDVEGQVRERMLDVTTRKSHAARQLAKHELMQSLIYRHFSPAHEVPVGPNGEKALTQGAMFGDVHKAFSAQQQEKMDLHTKTATKANDALMLALNTVQAKVGNAPGVDRALRDQNWSVGGVSSRGLAYGMRVTNPEQYEALELEQRRKAYQSYDWMQSFAMAMGESLSESHGGKSPEITDAIGRFTKGLFTMAHLRDGDPSGKEALRGNARLVAKSVKDLRELGISDLEIDAIRDQFVTAGTEIRSAVDQAGSGVALEEEIAAKEDKRASAARNFKEPVMGEIADVFRRMGAELDTLREHFGDEEWDDAYKVQDFTEMKVDEDWFVNMIPQITADFLANSGNLKEEQVLGLMNEFDQATQEEILNLVRKTYTDRAQTMKGAVQAEGYDPEELFGMDHREQLRALQEERNALIEETHNIESQATSERRRLGDAAQDEFMHILEGNTGRVAEIDSMMAAIAQETDPTKQMMSLQMDQEDNLPRRR